MSKSATFDFSEFEAFAKNFHKQAYEANAKEFLIGALELIGDNTLRVVKSKTPEGHYGTTIFRAVGERNNKKLIVFEGDSQGKTGGNLRRSWEVTEVKYSGKTFFIQVINPEDYASFVEDGHRGLGKKTKWVEGEHMLELTLEKIENQIPRLVKKDYIKYLKKFGVE
ncbi:HK97 gp10 family phage protein [Bavariicoccus seileri]|uniref:HK97 gp10 family phage protein n=1 Tax=Bavariicoccus seileri TaxID=549685 RepID=UPI0003B3C5BD|nr:HK97 gp10 family phage protein [Bavariicoccus seileri]